jgi:hypothetical protein
MFIKRIMKCAKDYKRVGTHQHLLKGGLLSPVWEKGVQAFQKLIVNSYNKIF